MRPPPSRRRAPRLAGVLVLLAVAVLPVGCTGEAVEAPKTWPAAPVAALGGSTASMEVRRSGYVLEYALVVTDGAERALVAAQGDRGMAFRFLDAAGAPVISSRIPAHGVKAVRASDGAVDRFSLTGVEPCSETEFRRIAGWELVATPR